MDIGSKVYVICGEFIEGRCTTTYIGRRILKEKSSDDVWIVETIEESPKTEEVNPQHVFSSFERAWNAIDYHNRSGQLIVR